MTTREEDETIGKLTREHAEAKRHLAALSARAREYADVFDHLKSDLRGVEYLNKALSFPDKYPEAAALRDFLDDLQRTKDTIARCRELLKQAGIEL